MSSAYPEQKFVSISHLSQACYVTFSSQPTEFDIHITVGL
jgi:hypothetical protein